jgi:pantetheine-phosphate adenylyltransferase
MTTTGVYAGSFDPPTNGHVWMIERAARLFDRLIVAVARNPEKQYGYAIERREAWLREICAGVEADAARGGGPSVRVEVARIENEFLAHYARRQGARFVVRGIRDEADYQYERGMRYINSDLNPELTTAFLMPPRALCQISSSLVKGMIGPEGWQEAVRAYVPACVYADLVGTKEAGA